MTTTTASVKDVIQKELPELLQSDPELRIILQNMLRGTYADRQETDDRFSTLLAELRHDREEQTRKWEANQAELTQLREVHNRKWEANQAELKQMREEHNRKWEANQAELKQMREEHNRKWDEWGQRWDANQAEQKRLWNEQNRKWETNQQELRHINEAIIAQAKKHDRSVSALGARWGLQSERAFRKALSGILEKNFDVEVLNVNEYDDAGEVFGRPDQIELDIIIKNGVLLIMELKSSMSKGDMYTFERKARFYERHHQRTADRLLVISPMIDARARPVAEALGIELYDDSLDVQEI